MAMNRRTVLSLAGGAIIVGGAGYLGWHSLSPPPAPPPGTPSSRPSGASSVKLSRDQASEAEHQATRGLGDLSAKTTITEYFSLTCTHCAAFAKETMPLIEKDLIKPGKVRFVFHDFPLDQVALTAAMVARYLPPNQYYPFVSALLASQDRWAFARGVNTTEEIWKLAALAGMSRDTFNEALADEELRNWILHQQEVDQTTFKIDSTPSFVIDGKKYSGEMSYDAFRKLLPDA
jgi:protein-disulfide isomerase